MVPLLAVTSREQPPPFSTTWYLEHDAHENHPESRRLDWIARVLADPIERRPDDVHPQRTRVYGYIAEAGKYMRVVLEPDGAVLNAFFDRNYGRARRRGGR